MSFKMSLPVLFLLLLICFSKERANAQLKIGIVSQDSVDAFIERELVDQNDYFEEKKKVCEDFGRAVFEIYEDQIIGEIVYSQRCLSPGEADLMTKHLQFSEKKLLLLNEIVKENLDSIKIETRVAAKNLSFEFIRQIIQKDDFNLVLNEKAILFKDKDYPLLTSSVIEKLCQNKEKILLKVNLDELFLEYEDLENANKYVISYEEFKAKLTKEASLNFIQSFLDEITSKNGGRCFMLLQNWEWLFYEQNE